MKKKILSCLLVLAMLVSMLAALPISVGAVEDDPATPYDESWYTDATELIIENEADLLAFSKAIADGKTFENQTVKLNDDITMTPNKLGEGVNWYVPANDTNTHFKGIFDGQGHIISGIQYNQPNYTHSGIIAPVANGAKVQNVTIVNSTLTTNRDRNTGGLFGQQNGADSTIQNVYADIAITKPVDKDVIGGFVGGVWNTSLLTITDSVFAGTITSSNAQKNVGGFVGISGCSITIENCGFFGTMSSTKSNDRWSKFIGRVENSAITISINNCIAGGTLTTTAGDGYVGSFIGQKATDNNSTDNSSSTVNVKNSLHTGVTVSSNTLSQELVGKPSQWNAALSSGTTGNTYTTDASLQGISAQSILPAGWVASTAANGNPVPAALVGIAPVQTVETPKTEVVGYQATTAASEKFDLRLVGVISGTDDVTDLAAYSAVGFRVVAHYTDATSGLQVKTNVATDTTVYSSLKGGSYNDTKDYTAADLGGLIFALNCQNIPANSGVITFEVTPIIVEGTTEVEGDTVVFAVDPTTGLPVPTLPVV